MAKHNDLGDFGEERAADYLRSQGYILRHQNWKSGKKELDIVAEKENVLVVVEVKTRSTDSFLHPKDTVTNAKIRHTVHAAEAYIFKYDLMMETRFDIVSVIPGEDGHFTIEHIEDAFLPPVN
jgi:putative endonuclease